MLHDRKIDSKIILTFLTLSLINIATFFLAETFLKGVFNRLSFFSEKNSFYALGFITFVGFALSYYFVTHYLIVNMPKLFVFVFATSEILMFLLAMITAYFIRGYGNNGYIADAVKMGYPQFWICILLGLCGVFILSKNVVISEN
jgi:magnesium-transporting ATPase (P-type)